MEILRHSGYGFQKIKTGRSKSFGIKGVVAYTFNLGYTFSWRQYKTLEGRSPALALLPACSVGLSNC